MADIIMAETMDVSEETYKFTIDLIDINTISFNIMNTKTGIKYNLNIKKEDKWFNENSHKIQNDFSQLYHILNDCVDNSESEFKYGLLEEKDNINFKISMKKETKFFKLDLEFNLERHISENGLTDDRLNSLEYQFNKLKEEKLNIQSNIIIDSLKKRINELEEKVTKNYDLENKVYHLIGIINMFGPTFMLNISESPDKSSYGRNQFGTMLNVTGIGQVPENPTDFIDQLINNSKTSPTGGKWVSSDGVMEIINTNGYPGNPGGLDWSKAAWDVVKSQKGWNI
jgi:hypothetical protein